MLQAELKVVGGKHHGKVIALTRQKFLVGREEDCHLRPNSELVSRHHCIFTKDEYTLRLRDFGSTNGTFVNDERVRGEVRLESGDRVRIGKLDFEVVISQASAAEQPEAVPAGDALPPLTDGEEPSLGGDTAELSAGETSLELPVSPTAGAPEADSGVYGGDGTVAPQAPGAPGQQPVGEYQQPPYPPQYPPPQYQQPGVPYPPPGMYPQPPQYYPQPGMYPQQPVQQYPQPGMYPQQPMPQYSQPGYSPPPGSAGQENQGVQAPPVRLPEPEDTGASAPAEKTASASENASENADERAKKPAPDQENPSNRAADIIKKYRHRR